MLPFVARTWFNAEVDTWTGADARRLRKVALRMSLREFADHLGVPHRTVSKWEQAGAAREPRPHMQAILDTALAQADDAAKARFEQAGASNDLPDKLDEDHPSPDTPRRGRTPAPDRRQFLQTLGAVGAVGMGASLDGIAHELEALAPRATVSKADIARLRSAGEFFSSWSHAHGSEQIGHAVSSEMSRAANLLKLPCPPRLRTELLGAVGQLGVATGALLFDSHQHQLADRVLAFATACAEDCGDWYLRAKSLSWRARQAVWVGDAEGALTLSELGLVRHDRLTATEQAMLFTAVARAHGRRGDVDATLQAVGEADDAFAQADPGNDVPWMAYYDYAQHCGDTGHALAELAVHGVRVEDTTRRLAIAVDQHPDTYIRSRVISGFKLAALTMRTGDPDHAVEIAQAAVDDAAGVLSKRLHRTAMEITQSARLHQHDQRDQVAEVLETVRTVGVAS